MDDEARRAQAPGTRLKISGDGRMDNSKLFDFIIVFIYTPKTSSFFRLKSGLLATARTAALMRPRLLLLVCNGIRQQH